MNTENNYGHSLSIEVVTGGFILTYPVLTGDGLETTYREVFSTTRKLQNKVKEVIEQLSTTPEPVAVED